MEYPFKEVYFDEFCSQCVFEENLESEKPCDECLEEPVNEYSHKPVKFMGRNHEYILIIFFYVCKKIYLTFKNALI